MSKNLQRVFALDIRNAELEGVKNLFENWNKERSEGEQTQMQWQAIVERLKGDALMDAFRADSGIATNTTNYWSKGEELPSEKMCEVYIKLLIEKIDKELKAMVAQRRKLLEPPKPKEPVKDPNLPATAIRHFEMPEDLPGDKPITELEDYYTLSSRTRDCLKNDNIVHAVDLLRSERGRDTWQKVMLRMPNFGKKCLSEVYQFMVKNGFKPTLAE